MGIHKKRLYAIILIQFFAFFVFTSNCFTQELDPLNDASDNTFKILLKSKKHKTLERSLRMDPLYNTKKRQTVPGGFTSSFGVQVHPSCIKYAKKYNISRKNFEDRFEKWITEAFHQVAGNCHTQYPELEGYIKEWVSYARRTVITCSSKKINLNKDSKAIAVNVHNKLSAWWLLKEQEYNGISTDTFFGSLSKNYKPIIIFSLESFLTGLNLEGNNSKFNNLLIHEIFHSTGANNRKDHNKIESKDPNDKFKCSINNLDDRINIVSQLCTGDKTELDQLNLDIFKRIGTCGWKKGCLDVFTNENDSIFEQILQKTKGLSINNAKNLCEKIYEDGRCKHEITRDGETVTQSHPDLVKLGKIISKKLDQNLPKFHNDLPLNIINSDNNLNDFYIQIKDTKCFQSLFNLKEKKLIIKSTEPGLLPIKNKFRVSSALFTIKKMAINDVLVNGDNCKTDNDVNNINQFVDLYEKNLTSVVDSKAMTQLAFPRWNKEAEKQSHLKFINKEENKKNEAFRSFLGPNLFDHYLQTLNYSHHKSSHFSCMKAGFRKSSMVKDLDVIVNEMKNDTVKSCN